MKKLKASRGESIKEPDEIKMPDRLVWIWDAFCFLSRCRISNQTGPQPIQASEIAAYCRDLAFITSPEDVDDLVHHVTELDIVWLKKTHARIEAEREKARRKNENRGRRR